MTSTSPMKPFTLVLGVAFMIILLTVLMASISGGKFDLRSRAGNDSCITGSKTLACPSTYPDKRNPKPNVWACCKTVVKPTATPKPKPSATPTAFQVTGSPSPKPSKTPTPKPNSCVAQGGKCLDKQYQSNCTQYINGTCDDSNKVCVRWSSCSTTPATSYAPSATPTAIPIPCKSLGIGNAPPFTCTGNCPSGKVCKATSSYYCECK